MFDFCLIEPQSSAVYIMGTEMQSDPTGELLESLFGIPSHATYMFLLSALYGQIDDTILANPMKGVDYTKAPSVAGGTITEEEIHTPASVVGGLSFYIHGHLIFMGRTYPEAVLPKEDWLTLNLCPDHQLTLKSRTLVFQISPSTLQELSFVDSWRGLSEKTIEQFSFLHQSIVLGTEGNTSLVPLVIAGEEAEFDLAPFMWVPPAEAFADYSTPDLPVRFTTGA